MENEQQFSFEQSNADHSQQQNFYPPKPMPEDKKGNVWLRSLTSLALYVIVGYYFFQNNWMMLLILTVIVIFHELGHFTAMKIYNYKDLGIFFIPLLGAYASGTKREVSQKESVIILLAGPLPGIIAGLLIYFFHDYRNSESIYYSIDLLRWASFLLIALNVLNLLPIYPLDGGQLLNRLFLDESKIISKIFIVLSAGVMVWLALWGLGRPFYPLLAFPALMLLRLRTDTRFDKLTKLIEDTGINLEKTYDEITDEEYWKIRNILIEKNYPTVRMINPAPPYEYSANEDRVVTTIEGLLQRTIVQDLSWWSKLIVIIIWVAAFASPFLIEFDIPISLFRR